MVVSSAFLCPEWFRTTQFFQYVVDSWQCGLLSGCLPVLSKAVELFGKIAELSNSRIVLKKVN